ncbi:MAG TPA: bifunctional precorrin-2 dehydrogenase/sirohydrochlorin ferrochelatase [Deltaproteobacteria bacterium]|nr:bifunctional precorrin-2 dehydrogenase/sirohydrochlorin ferrochelatase [Deltaproteobacteria bacterium]
MERSENIYYPIFIDLTGKQVVVIGGGVVAERKIESLLKAGARVRVIAPEVLPGITSMDGIEIRRKTYASRDLDDAVLVIAATDDEETNRTVSQDAERARLFCNVVDRPELCSYIVPSVLEKGPIKIAISTGGVSPALSKKLRSVIGSLLGDEYSALSVILGRIRPVVLSQEGGHEGHRRVFDVLINSQLIDAIREGDRDLVDAILFEALGVHVDLEGVFP